MSSRSIATDVPKQVSGATMLITFVQQMKLKLAIYCSIEDTLIQFSFITFHFLSSLVFLVSEFVI